MANGNDYIELAISTLSEEQSDILIANLSDIGFEGFEEEKNLLKAFIVAKDFNEQLLHPIINKMGLKYVTSVIKYKNWNEEWEAGFEPVTIGDFCTIRATFHQAVEGVKHDIIITPKMSFGTGHHATTYLMIEAMKQIDMEGKSVFDFGTGTGILAILAEKMGANIIEAIDVDDWSIENGEENLQKNKCNKILLYKSEEITSMRKFDVLLANINRNVILQHLEAMKAHLFPGGLMVLSGLLTGDADIILRDAGRLNMKNISMQERNSWISLQFVKGLD
ncbi:MAG: 50S ribosomal protein L11 methyltransferase [Chitinophagaceae bacterium]